MLIKYGRMQKRIPSHLVCGSCGVCLDCALPGVQVTTGMGFFSAFPVKAVAQGSLCPVPFLPGGVLRRGGGFPLHKNRGTQPFPRQKALKTVEKRFSKKELSST